MPIYPAWDPKTGGSYRAGEKWIIEHIGRRPAKGFDLHIIDRRKGFVPWNLSWVPRDKHKSEEMLNRVLVENRRLAIEVSNYEFLASLETCAAE